MNIITTTQRTIARHRLISYGDTIIVGVSGGADSVALLLILAKLRYTHGLNLVTVHVNHQLRKAADTDERFVKKLCAQLNIPCFCRSLAKNSLQKQKGSLEDLAREKRLAIFIETAKIFQANSVALAHHQDDLAETVLMRILRGTGLQGLQAILPKRVIHGINVIRPLLEISRADIEQFLKEHSIKYRTDATNSETVFFRNKIRLQLLPLLTRAYNPGIKKILAHLADTAAVDYDFIHAQAQKILPRIVKKKSADHFSVSLKKLSQQHLGLQRAVLRLVLEKLQGNTNRLTLNHFQEIEDLIDARPDGSVVHLPAGLSATKKGRELSLKIRKP